MDTGFRPATKARSLNFFEHLEEELGRNGFLRHPESRPSMVRNLRNLFQRAQCTEQELRTLHGVVTAFAGPRKRQSVGVRRVGSRREGLISARSRSNFVAARLGETEYRAQISESGESAR